jgi:predicted phosphate transport protein (TIGR00153 family)
MLRFALPGPVMRATRNRHIFYCLGGSRMAKVDALIRWLMPKEERFHELFGQDTANLLSAARLFSEFVGCDLPTRRARMAALRDLEHTGDGITRQIFDALNSSFITPFDREDIRSLATDLDDILDYIEGVAQQLINFELTGCPPELRRFAEILVQMAAEIEQVTERIWNLARQSQIQQSIVQISDLENQADDLYNQVIADLFRPNGRDPLEIMKWKEIYDGLENACDQCKDYTHIVGNIIVKNA